VQHITPAQAPTQHLSSSPLVHKVVSYSITNAGLGADPGFLAVSPQRTRTST